MLPSFRGAGWTGWPAGSGAAAPPPEDIPNQIANERPGDPADNDERQPELPRAHERPSHDEHEQTRERQAEILQEDDTKHDDIAVS